jgi:hypothetical protein
MTTTAVLAVASALGGGVSRASAASAPPPDPSDSPLVRGARSRVLFLPVGSRRRRRPHLPSLIKINLVNPLSDDKP